MKDDNFSMGYRWVRRRDEDGGEGDGVAVGGTLPGSPHTDSTFSPNTKRFFNLTTSIMDHNESLKQSQRFEDVRSMMNLEIGNFKSAKTHPHIWKLNSTFK